MRSFFALFSRFRLKHQITLIAVLVFLIPTLLFSTIILKRSAASQMDQMRESVQSELDRDAAQANSNVFSCIIVSESFLNSLRLTDWFEKFISEGDGISPLDLLDFKFTEVTSNERLVNSNPFLVQVRIYLHGENVPEMIPLLYSGERARRQEWYSEDTYPAFGWYFDFSDHLFDTPSWSNEEHLASYFMPWKGTRGEVIGQLEVVSRMELLFPTLYQNDAQTWNGLITKDGNLFCDADAPWTPNIEPVLASSESYCSVEHSDGSTYVLCAQSLPALSGRLVTAKRLDEALSSSNDTQILLVIGISAFSLLFSFLISRMVDLVLRRFYRVIETLQEGSSETEEAAPQNKRVRDDLGLLDSSIRQMTDRIQTLLSERVERERRIRDSEIRALQNQINTHFISNVLESIKMIAEIDGRYEISDAITSLGKLLRYSMKWSAPTVRVDEELNYVENYVSLMRLRWDGEIRMDVDVPPALFSFRIPKMTLQPILENALTHGVEDPRAEKRVRVFGFRHEVGENPAFSIRVTDAGPGMTPEELEKLRKSIEENRIPNDNSQNVHGIGLQNVHERIRLLYGDPYGITVEAKEGYYTSVTLTFPCKQSGAGKGNV